jgi:multimeric flavodoxin WrbA
MNQDLNRRSFLGMAGAAGLAVTAPAALAAQPAPASSPLKILGVAGSMRPGKSTAVAVQIALQAAAAVNPRIVTEFIDLGGKDLWSGAVGKRDAEGRPLKDDFDDMLPKLRDPQLGGLILGSPSYFRSLSAQLKMFLERCIVLRQPRFLLADKVVGALSVGGFRNGGQELVIDQILTILLCHEAVLVGGKPRAHQGATLWNSREDDDITHDLIGVDTAEKLGARVAEAVLRMAPDNA